MSNTLRINHSNKLLKRVSLMFLMTGLLACTDNQDNRLAVEANSWDPSTIWAIDWIETDSSGNPTGHYLPKQLMRLSTSNKKVDTFSVSKNGSTWVDFKAIDCDCGLDPSSRIRTKNKFRENSNFAQAVFCFKHEHDRSGHQHFAKFTFAFPKMGQPPAPITNKNLFLYDISGTDCVGRDAHGKGGGRNQ